MPSPSAAIAIVKGFILSEFLPGEDPENLTTTTPLMSAGILDSLATLKLMSFLEQEFDIEVQPDEADEQNFNTLEAICQLIDSKR